MNAGASAASGAQSGVLGSATPVLISLVACLIALRVFAALMTVLASRLAGTRSVTAFLGATQAARDTRAAVAPLIAIGVGLGVVVFSTGVFATVQSGIHAEAGARAGSSLTVYSLTFTQPEMQALAAIDGVEASASVLDDANSAAQAGAARVPLNVIVVDSAEVRAVQSGFVTQTVLPPQAPGAGSSAGATAATASATADGSSAAPTTTAGSTPVPVIVSQSAAAALKTNDFTVRGQPVTVVGVQPDTSPLTTEQSWMLVDSSYAASIVGPNASISRGLFRFQSGEPMAAQIAQARAIADPFATVLVPTEIEHTLNANPTTRALATSLYGAAGLALLFSAVVVLMTLVAGAAARARLSVAFGALGVSRRRLRSMRLWEIMPVAVVATVAGVAAGVAEILLITNAVDLTPFTGAAANPAPSIPSGLVAVAVIAVLVVAVVGALTISPRTRLPKGTS